MAAAPKLKKKSKQIRGLIGTLKIGPKVNRGWPKTKGFQAMLQNNFGISVHWSAAI